MKRSTSLVAFVAVAFIVASQHHVSCSSSLPPPSLTRTVFLQEDFELQNCRVVQERPVKTGVLAVAPTTPAEQGYIHFYSSVVMFNTTDYRIYYFSKGAGGYRSHVALAPTPVGPWRKPALGIFEINGSSANNVVSMGIVVSVFLDNRPGVPANERVKAVSGASILVSPDGFRWSTPTMTIGWTHFDDTQPIVFWDAPSEQYIAGGRIDASWGWGDNSRAGAVTGGAIKSRSRNGDIDTIIVSDDDVPNPDCVSQPYPAATPGAGPGASRSVGMAVSPVLENGSFATATLVLGANQSRQGSGDSACVDLYTSALVRYEDVFLAFPSAYFHHRHTDPPTAPNSSAGRGNDGVLSVRLAYARAPSTTIDNSTSGTTIDTTPVRSSFVPGPFSYVNPAEPAAEWIPRGSGQFVAEDWRFVGSFDAGHVFMTRGLLKHSSVSQQQQCHGPMLPTTTATEAEWDTIVAYHHGSQLTHGGVDEWFAPNYHNRSGVAPPLLSGIERLEMRRDGFASLRVDPGSATGNASISVTLPQCKNNGTTNSRNGDKANSDQRLQLLLNAQAAVGGAIRVGLAGVSVPSGYSVFDSDEWTGDSVRGIVTWGAGARGLDLSPLARAGKPVEVTFKLVHSARIYAFEFRCVSD